MTVIFEAPVPVKAVVRGYQKRNTNDAVFLGAVPVRIQEARASDAPLAMNAEAADGSGYCYRTWNGRLVRSLRVNSGENRVLVTADNVSDVISAFVERACAADAATSVLWPFFPKRVVTRNITRPEDWREVRSTDREASLRFCRDSWTKEAVCVDGVIYVASHGPAWVPKLDVTRAERDSRPLGARQWIAPSQDVLTPYVALMPERAHLGKQPDGFPVGPDDLGVAEILLRTVSVTALGHPGNGRLATAACPVRGSVEGPAIRARRPGEVTAAETAAAGASLLKMDPYYLSSMDPSAIRAYADLKEVVTEGVAEADLGRAVEAVLNYHRLWAADRRTSLVSPADPAEPLLRRLGQEPPNHVTAPECEAAAPSP